MPKWYEVGIPAATTAVGSYFGGRTGGAAGNAAGNAIVSMIGGKKGKQETSSYQNIPPELLQAWMGTYVPAATNWYNSGSNEYQKQATASYGGGLAGLEQELPGYQKFYDDNLSNRYLRQLEDDSNLEREKIRARYAGRGGLNNTSVAAELGLLEKNKLNRVADYKHDMAAENFDKAVGLRRQTLADLMTAGDQPRQHIDQLGALLQRFPTGATGQNYQMPQQVNWGEASGAAMENLGKLFDNHQGNQASYVPAYDVTGWNDVGGQMPWTAPNYGYLGKQGQPGIY